jgi:hypothetical protein
MNTRLDPEYWQNQLEVPVVDALERTEHPGFFASWVDALSPACRRVAVREVGLAHDTPPPLVRKALLRFRDTLVPFVLVDAAMAGKRRSALLEVARTVLGADDLEEARAGSGLDRRALGWALYLRGAPNLLRVFHIDRVHRRGVARMALAERPRSPAPAAPDTFCRARVAEILDDYQRERGLCRLDARAETLTTAEQHVAFFKWPLKHAFVVRGGDNVFGFEREWVVLAFSHDFWRVRIASDSADAPARIAERIAATLFGHPVRYVNESVATPLETADRFVASLIDGGSLMPLVEAEVRTHARDDAPLVRVHNPGDESIAPELRQLQIAFGDEVTGVRRLGAVKVLAFGKRVRMVFELASADGVVVRYGDQVFAPDERDAFERRMRDAYGITVLSTEKQHAAA